MILPNKKGDFIMDCSIFDRVYAGMLKSASEFQTGNQDETIEYHFDPQLEKVVSKYHLTGSRLAKNYPHGGVDDTALLPQRGV